MKTKLLLVFMIVLLQSCSFFQPKEELAWNEAKLKSTFEAYQKYMREYPEGQYVYEADSLCDNLTWETVSNSKNDSTFEIYLQKYPNGLYAKDVNDSIKKYQFDIGNIYESDFPNFGNGDFWYIQTQSQKQENSYTFTCLIDEDIFNDLIPSNEGERYTNRVVAIIKINDNIEKFILPTPYSFDKMQTFQNNNFKINISIRSKETQNETEYSIGVMEIIQKKTGSKKTLNISAYMGYEGD